MSLGLTGGLLRRDWIATERGNPVYALAVVFAAYTEVRVAEL